MTQKLSGRVSLFGNVLFLSKSLQSILPVFLLCQIRISDDVDMWSIASPVIHPLPKMLNKQAYLGSKSPNGRFDLAKGCPGAPQLCHEVKEKEL